MTLPPDPLTGGPRERIGAGFRNYARKVRLFRRNARLYLGYTVVTGLALGVYRLLFNFYVLSLGYDEALIGRLITVGSLSGLLGALPVGLVADRIGRKRALLVSCVGSAVAMAGVVVWRDTNGLVAMSAALGAAQALGGVTLGPFLMENSGEEERTYLFSFSSGSMMIAGFVGNWLGGRLPAWLGGMVGAGPTDTQSYALALGAMAVIALLGAVPLAAMRRPVGPAEDVEDPISPIAYARSHPALLGKLIGPMLVTSLGAGLLMPFMNLFFRNAHGASDAAIGSLFAVGSLAMAVGLLAAPVLADRYGKARVMVATQGLSIPFLALLGFAPWFAVSAFAYLVRLALMNMSNPVYQNFVMEQVDARARATVASLVSISWNFGWAFSPTVSGWLQVNRGFDPVFALTMASYVIAIAMIWAFFVRGGPSSESAPRAGGV